VGDDQSENWNWLNMQNSMELSVKLVFEDFLWAWLGPKAMALQKSGPWLRLGLAQAVAFGREIHESILQVKYDIEIK
jgi:hypothetical protein